ncbi:MAG: type II toxin-antitoxin system RelE/ParE family toxin [Rhodospirillales bacterium]|nr:type II toxin-antitoxin system RelE/ParE family toxin [Rhodospirillales bacterium]
MIQSFRNRTLKRFFERGDTSRIHADHREIIRDILARLNASFAPEDMDLPGFRLHRLKGEYTGFWAVTVRANWRIIFRFDGSHAHA